MARKLFGTDGVRGVAGQLLTPELAVALGRAATAEVAGEDPRVLHTRFAALDLRGLEVALDCANGATYRVAPEVFRRLGATVTAIHDAPDGRNINAGCGSTHVERVVSAVVEGGHDAGFAF